MTAPDTSDADLPRSDVPARLVLKMLLHADQVKQERIGRVTSGQWTAILRRLREHRALPWLQHSLLGQAGLQVPENVVAACRQVSAQWASRQLMLARECILMSRALDAAKIPHLFLKGVPLAHLVYPRPGLRPAQDIDILVPRAHVYRAQQVILGMGGGTIPVYEGAREELENSDKHLPPIWSPNRIMPVELHARIFDGHADHATAEMEQFASTLFDRASSFPVAGQSLPCPCAEDMALHLISHSAYENLFDNGPLSLVDLALLLSTGGVDAHHLHSRASALGMGRGAAMMLRLAGQEGFGEDIPSDAVNAATSLLLQTRKGDEEKSLAVIKSVRRDGLRQAWRLTRRAVPKRQHLVYLGHRSHLPDPENWTYGRLWSWYLGTSLAKFATFVGSPHNRNTARNMLALRGWMIDR